MDLCMATKVSGGGGSRRAVRNGPRGRMPRNEGRRRASVRLPLQQRGAEEREQRVRAPRQEVAREGARWSAGDLGEVVGWGGRSRRRLHGVRRLDHRRGGRHAGPLGEALACTLAYERCNWAEVAYASLGNGSIADAYAESLTWSREITEGLLNQVEVAIRAYDPCLSCATHALGRMPLEVSAYAPDGELVSRLVKNSRGELSEAPTC